MHHFNHQPSNTPANANARVTGQPAAHSQSAFVPTPSLQSLLILDLYFTDYSNLPFAWNGLAANPEGGNLLSALLCYNSSIESTVTLWNPQRLNCGDRLQLCI
ncbi:hypothetical protein GCK72_025863 [Caenorhabditis remanei]|uniref:Uncharacterized protein n=1 Tax=Caenorhabditis remanei TaxID=31234 RepID=A0A6A5G3V2_CAERE|nr:hypothetical protein GCK72_025863 [Caenorhabditis remanei]KAF1749395.1 hypothetical protein GCK72_025863 [Caenorhabditis remanei]